jgi:uncharacterized membrane protein YoaK (UPF0700 family)
MIYKIPQWAWIGAGFLAFVAGTVNVVGFVGFTQKAVTHLTGTTSLLAAAVAEGDGPAMLQALCAIASFVAGCALSGFIIKDGALKAGRQYGLVMLIECVGLCGAIFLLERHELAGIYLAAAACGLQNAMVSTFSGAVIRTTHVSGMFTDLGIFLGHVLRGMPVEIVRLKLCGLIILAFFAGGVAGALGFHYYGYFILFLPVALTGLAALYYELRYHRQPRAPGEARHSGTP